LPHALGPSISTAAEEAIRSSSMVHTNARDEAFLRVGDETRRLTFDQRRELEFDKGQNAFELTPTRWLVSDDLDTELL
jgi:ATP-dependent DNA helicase RecG